MTPEVYKKRINLLFRIRQKMRDNMTQSGTHDDDPWNFVDVAMNKIPGGRRLPKVGILYFFRRCEEFPNIDTSFQTFLDNSLKGSTASGVVVEEQEVLSSDDRSNKKAKLEKDRSDAFASIRSMSAQSARIYDEFHRSNSTMERFKHLEVELEYAKALGEMERIRELATELRAMHKKSD